QLRGPVARQKSLVILCAAGSRSSGLRRWRLWALNGDRARALLRLRDGCAGRRRGEENQKANGRHADHTPHPLPLSRKGRGESRNRSVRPLLKATGALSIPFPTSIQCPGCLTAIWFRSRPFNSPLSPGGRGAGGEALTRKIHHGRCDETLMRLICFAAHLRRRA